MALLQATEGEHLAVVVQPKYLPSQTLNRNYDLSCDKCVQPITVIFDADGKESHLKELLIRDVKHLA